MTKHSKRDDVQAAIADKTIPSLRGDVTGKEFRKDYLVQLDDSSKIPDELEAQQHIDLRETAIARGLRPTGDPKLVSAEPQDARNVLLVYALPVVGAFEDVAQAPDPKPAVVKAAPDETK